MTTDLSLAIAGRRKERLGAVRNEVFLLAVPTVCGLISTILAVRIPAVAAAIILAGLQ